jgi:FtsP/CotA-like multicopper oxidase with cupredoxin domain
MNKELDRRTFLGWVGTVAGGAVLARSAGAASPEEPAPAAPHAHPTPAPTPAPAPETVRTAPAPRGSVVTPNGSSLAWRVVGGVKVGKLVAEEVEHEFAPGMRARCWGYNGTTPGPTLELNEGDKVRIYVENRLPEPTTVHWHGLVVPNGMDGVAGLTQPPIPPGATWVYAFTAKRPGTYLYHSHYDEMTQIALGMSGFLLVHPRVPPSRVDRDFALLAHEWRLDVGAARPDPLAMSDFNVLTFNGKAFPATAPLMVGRGERVRVRLGNLGPMDHHPIHLHGVSFRTTATDGGFVPASAQLPETTVLVPVGSTRVIEFVPEELGDWAVHCHMTHHVMLQMGHGLPNLLGADTAAVDARMARLMPAYMTMGTDGSGGMGEMSMPIPPNSLPMKGGPGPFSYVDMGGMFTVLKVREDPDRADPSAWYQHPEGTVARPADPAQLAMDLG